MRAGLDSVNGKPLQDKWNRRIGNNLYRFIPK